MPAQRQPPPPVGLRLGCGEIRCLCLGVERGPHMWEGPQGVGSQGQVLGFSSCLGTRWAGVEGEDKEAAHSLSQKKEERPAEGAGPRLSPMPCDAGSSVRVCPGDPRPRGSREEASSCGAKSRVQRPCPSSNLKALITAFGESPGGGRGPLLSAWGRAGSFLPSMNQRETEAPGLLAREGPQPSGHLDFLGFSADLVIVVNADGDKKEATGQEQQNPQGHEAGLG